MKSQIIDYPTYIKETEIDKLMEYLFPSEYIFETETITVPIKGKRVNFKDKKNDLQTYLNDLKREKELLINGGELGGSLYVRILKDGNTHILIRISYHSPNEDFGTGKSNKNTIGFLCIDVLNNEDEKKILQIRKENFPHKLQKNDLKEDHKKSVDELGEKYKYEDLGTEDYQKIIESIKTFLKSKNLNLYENINFEDFSVFYRIDYDD